jgi:hypothetical protein
LWFGATAVAHQSIRDWKGESGDYIYGAVAVLFLQQFLTSKYQKLYLVGAKKHLKSRRSKNKHV